MKKLVLCMSVFCSLEAYAIDRELCLKVVFEGKESSGVF